jgi:hypothetical protein
MRTNLNNLLLPEVYFKCVFHRCSVVYITKHIMKLRKRWRFSRNDRRIFVRKIIKIEKKRPLFTSKKIEGIDRQTDT